MPSSTASRNGTSDTSAVMAEAGRVMLPVLSGKLLAAVADRAVDAVDSLAGRLDDFGAGQRDPAARAKPAETDRGAPGSTGVVARSGAAWSLVLSQARVLLDFLMTLLARAAEYLRGLAARARRQAPEGHDAEREALDAVAT